MIDVMLSDQDMSLLVTSLVFLVWRARLFSEDHAASFRTSSLLAASPSLEMSPTTVVSSAD